MSDLTACRDCAYWLEEKQLMPTPQGPTRVGQCRRRCPQVAVLLGPQGSAPTSLFPVTTALQSCGEFEARGLIET